MGGWKGKGKDNIIWEGVLEADAFIGDGSKLSGISAGSETDPIWSAQSGTVNTHIASAAIHFTSGAIQTHISSEAIHFTSGSIWTEIDNSIASGGINTATIDTVSGALVTHEASDAIHFTSGAIWTDVNASITSGAVNTSTIDTVSGAVVTNTTNISNNETSGGLNTAHIVSTSGALSTHSGDASDPHGATLTQTKITNTYVTTTTASGANIINTGDHTTSGAAYVVGIITAPSATPPTASNFPRGTIFLQYTA